MFHSLTLSFRKDFFIIDQSDSKISLKTPIVELKIKQLKPGFLRAIQILASNGATEKHLSELVLQVDGEIELIKFYYYLQKFTDLYLICHTIVADERSMATIVPISMYYKFSLKNVKQNQKYVLSRFAYCRKDKNQLVLESPLSYGQIILCDWRSTAIVTELSKPKNLLEVCTSIPGISEDAAQQFFSLLWSTGFLSEVTEEGKVKEEENLTFAQWSFHDLLFHSRSRLGRHIKFYRDDSRFVEIERPPVVKPKMSNHTIELYKPNLEKLKQTDYPFTLILEERKTIRSYANKPLTDKQLGEFLYRSARVKSILETENGEQSSRVYPGAGANYELELYITVNRCSNINSGLYHYCPKEHQLCKLADKNKNVQTLLQGAAEAARQPQENLQVLITIAARFPRQAWQLEAIAYATTLKNVGVLYQTMYLVATAMDLAPCALSFGDSDLFAKVAGTDYYAETSVGEFLLGSKPTD